MKELNKRILCRDGFSLSIQASEFHYCEPRNNQRPYTHVEVGFPSEREELLMPYAEDQEHPTETVYGWVPRSVIEAVILKHNGGCAIKELTFNVEVKK